MSCKISIRSTIRAQGGRIIFGENVTVHERVIIHAQGGEVRIGDNVSINPGCVIYGGGGVTIGRYTLLAAATKIIAQGHNYKSRDLLIKKQGSSARGISVGEDVWCGVNVVVLDGVTIGNGAVVGAGSIVTKSVEAYSVNAGNPSRQIAKRE
jgi:acetyltransferase-like isoleucine patch superfamily enzyme